jgi:hypothetical protein
MEKKILFRFDIMKIDIGNQRNRWENLKKEIKDLTPPENFGTEAIDRAFVDLIAAIDYSKFLIKG